MITLKVLGPTVEKSKLFDWNSDLDKIGHMFSDRQPTIPSNKLAANGQFLVDLEIKMVLFHGYASLRGLIQSISTKN